MRDDALFIDDVVGGDAGLPDGARARRMRLEPPLTGAEQELLSRITAELLAKCEQARGQGDDVYLTAKQRLDALCHLRRRLAALEELAGIVKQLAVEQAVHGARS
jgi:hypothetical protein